MNVQPQASLQSRSGMATPCYATYLVEIENHTELLEALDFAVERNLKFVLLGEGSNTVFVNDYAGLVIVNRMRGIEILRDTEAIVQLTVAGGENWHALVTTAMHNGWYGLENLALIPGSVGAAPVQNIGAYGVEVASMIERVEYLDTDTRTLQTLSALQCDFAYRDSIFKSTLANQAVITRVWFRLRKKPQVNCDYVALREHLNKPNPTPQQVFDAVCEIRTAKLPLPSAIPNCGSFFKNPVVSASRLDELQADFPQLVSFPFANEFKLSAAWLIDQAGWKGRAHCGVCVHEQHALVITNPLRASGQAVRAFAESIREDIQQKYGVLLENEPVLR